MLAIFVLIRPVEAHAFWLWDWFSGSGSSQLNNPLSVNETYAALQQVPALTASHQPPGDEDDKSCDTNSMFVQDSAIVGTSNPTDSIMTCAVNPYGQIFVYTIQEGDIPGKIAERFGITLNTLLWANDIQNPRTIKVGDKLIILPVSGVKYVVKTGDTIQSIAKKFKGDVSDILSFNNIGSNEKLAVGTEIIIPDGEITTISIPSTSTGAGRFSGLPDMKGYWMRPIVGGRKTQGIHGYNGVDLASACGEQVFASAAGTVLVAKDGGWNAGYGKYVVILHPNGVQTLYAHLLKLFTRSGDKVSQGQSIGTEGNTGRTTGCHIHFEIRGARNPF